ncbi:MAG: VOC family protein [Hyphomicrobiales bacterium]|nr:VOC family protein [Alphaproteobacteria bacterium]
MIKVLRIGHATFETPDLAKAIAHYTEVIGLSLVGREDKRAFLATRLGHLAIELQQGTEARCRKLSFEVAAHSEFGDLKKALQAHGVAAEERNDSVPGLPKVLSFQDPKGTTIELFREWTAIGNREQVIGAGAFKLGHVAFVTPDPLQMAEFYGKVLGFRISDWIGDFFVFMRCNADHHSVNFIAGKSARMHHIAYELRDFSHLQTACDLFGDRKIPIIWGPVRLGPGHNVAAFHRDHDDWVVELYAELDQMKDDELGYFDPRPWHQDRPQRPKVWDAKMIAYMWGPPPTADFMRSRD